MEKSHYPFVNPPLPYAYHALEPFIDELTMHLHHDKHLQGYVDKLNQALEGQPCLQELTLKQLLTRPDCLPEALRVEVQRNAGGVYNHLIYFEGMAPRGCGGRPTGLFEQAITRRFGGLEQLVAALRQAAMGVFGSGYAWLVLRGGELCLTTTANQDTPLPYGLEPILTVDVWEHAYYLKHYNLRASYLEDWLRVVDWSRAQQRYDAGLARADTMCGNLL